MNSIVPAKNIIIGGRVTRAIDTGGIPNSDEGLVANTIPTNKQIVDEKKINSDTIMARRWRVTRYGAVSVSIITGSISYSPSCVSAFGLPMFNTTSLLGSKFFMHTWSDILTLCVLRYYCYSSMGSISFYICAAILQTTMRTAGGYVSATQKRSKLENIKYIYKHTK